ncbi:MAG TPA: 5-(carboxyamino)imidazole ribonucleotide mutase [bacterium (Candidatus Stahlbacteria)]|nr:5-(carboxyamino)imidazole ribonucleotide mutase [Candidatus Stahlbacteria bacterium]
MVKKTLVAIIMGSDTDLPQMKEAAHILDEFGVGYELRIISAHRTPDMLEEYSSKLDQTDIEVIIAGAGGAAHLPGVIAAHTNLPVIGVPMGTKSLAGLDSLLSIVQMPAGIPVATMAIGKAGASNAAIFALEILARKYPEIGKKLKEYRKELAQKVKQRDEQLKELGYKVYLEKKEK